jgi:putative RecB family exonuclease
MWQAPNSISPSRMSLFLQCPLQFRMTSIQKLPSGTGAAAVAGTTVHAALELLMELPGHLRTPEALSDFVETCLVAVRETDDYQSLTEAELKKFGFDATVRRVAPRAFDMLDVPHIPVSGVELRLEVDFEGWILRGIMDLVTGSGTDLAVLDWKSGRTPSERYQTKAMMGIDFYAVMATHHFGEIPREVALLYLSDRTTISREPSERTVKATENKIRAVRGAIERACEKDSFEASTSPLCNWCPCQPYCPAHGGNEADLPVSVEIGRA